MFGDPFQLEHQIACGLPTIVGILRQAPRHDVVEPRGSQRLERGYRGRIRMENRANQARRRRALKRALPCRHLVDNRAEGKDVGARVGLSPLELFRRHVGIGAQHGALRGERRRVRPNRGQRDRSGVGCSFDKLKSRSFAPLFVSITLPGLRSRCTSPRRCAWSSASASSAA